MRVLVVEDQALTAVAVVLELERAGYETCGPAYTSQEALALARTYRPKIALVDITLEEPRSGIQLAEQLRSELGVHVIYMTSQVDLAREHASCAVGLIAKPFALRDAPDSVAAVAAVAQLTQSGGEQGIRIPRAFELFERPRASERKDVQPAPSPYKAPEVA